LVMVFDFGLTALYPITCTPQNYLGLFP
jgi:hypothetical protein